MGRGGERWTCCCRRPLGIVAFACFFWKKKTQALFLPGVLLMKEELRNLGDSRLSVVYVCWGSCCALWWILISAGRRTSTLRLLWCPSLSFAWGKRTRECQCEVSEDYSKTIEGNWRYMIYITDRWWWWWWWWWFQILFFVPLPSADGFFCWFGARWFGFLGCRGSEQLTISWYLASWLLQVGRSPAGDFTPTFEAWVLQYQWQEQ